MSINSTDTVGFSSLTPQHLLVDAGAIYINYGIEGKEALLGACSGANEFDVSIKTYKVKVNSMRSSNVKGYEFITDVLASLKVNLLEATTNTLKMAIQGAEVDTTTDPNFDIISVPRRIGKDVNNYLDNVALVGRLSGSEDPVIIILKNAVATGGLKIKLEDDKDNVLPLTFEAYADTNSPRASIFDIYYPKSVSVSNTFYVEDVPYIDNGKVLMTFSDTVNSTVPKDGFVVTVGGVTNTITGAARGVNNYNTILLTLTTTPTSGQVVTVGYTKPELEASQVTSIHNVALASFNPISVTNN